MSAKVKIGDRVSVNYEGRLESGEVFDSSYHGDHAHPIDFEVGAGEMISGFDHAVVGMQKDEEKEVKILAKDAYGEHNPQLEYKLPKSSLPTVDQELKAGMVLVMGTPDGRQFPVKIVAISDTEVTVDLNHPLAGKTLIFKVKMMEIHSK